jgi:hypothetical protein
MDTLGVERECARGRTLSRGGFSEDEERRRVATVTKRHAGVLEPPVVDAEEGDRPRPRRPVSRPLLGPKLRAERKELRETGDDGHLSE